MKIGIVTPMLLFVSQIVNAQIKFEAGYIINGPGDKTNCLIKNFDWKNNPVQIEYKLSESASVQTASPDQVKEFGIGEQIKYIGAEVVMDESSDQLKDLSQDKAPQFIRKKVFLRVLLEGKASLYEVITANYLRYFYQKQGDSITQLIYKTYQLPEFGTAVNYTYRAQLNKEINCGNTALTIKSIQYTRSELLDYFKDYNRCEGSTASVFNIIKRPLKFSLKPHTGIDFYTIYINERKDQDVGIRASMEAEAILPYFRSKWAVFIEPAYEYFQSGAIEFSVRNAHLEYQGIEVPLGVRHYLYLSDLNKLFFNFTYALNFPIISELRFDSGPPIDAQNTYSVLGIGGGFMMKRWSLELRGNSRLKMNEINILRGILGFNKYSLTIGYRLL